ncbi:MAG: NlpC/P60 family protein [Flavobacteriaceae bacterium]|nr:NlpC/P60 family protein [Flavobacteriaceae bacterium]
MNGYVIPRDASQQIFAGKVVDPHMKFEGLEKGDLLFFGNKASAEKKQKVTHVGIWLGGGEFIHASKQVRISSIDPASALFDKTNQERYLGSRRYLDQKDPQIQNLDSLFQRITEK